MRHHRTVDTSLACNLLPIERLAGVSAYGQRERHEGDLHVERCG